MPIGFVIFVKLKYYKLTFNLFANYGNITTS